MPLLTDLERDRLLNRSNEDARSRAINDRRVRKKLGAWLSGLSDAAEILDFLPADQTNKILRDQNVYDLLSTGMAAALIKQFSPISGKLDEPENWKLKSTRPHILRDIPRGENATDLDIYRALYLHDILFFLNRSIVNTKIEINTQNPIDVFRSTVDLFDSKLDNRLTTAELKGVTRVRQAWYAIAEKEGLLDDELRSCLTRLIKAP